MSGLKLLTDEALCENTKEMDGLGFNRYAEVLSDAVAQTDGPFTIGIFGEWGTGKTSLMHLIHSDLERKSSKKSIVTVWFDAWKYEKEEHPVIPLIASIVKQLEERNKSKFGTVIGVLRSIASGISINATLAVPGIGEVGTEVDPKAMLDKFNASSLDPLLAKSLYFGAFEQLSSAVPENSRIVVLIDDLDRCLPDSAIKLLESLKLVFAQKGFIFIIGVARKIIEGYLTHRYQEKYGIKGFKGHLYLDKLVQLPVYLPSHQLMKGSFFDQVINKIDDESAKRSIAAVFHIVAMASNNNPRNIIRFTNILLIDNAILAVSSNKSVDSSSISLSYFAVTRCLQTVWSLLFDVLMESDDLCREVGKWEIEELADKTELKGRNRAFVAGCCIDDVAVRSILFSPEGKQWLNDSDARRKTVDFLSNKSQNKEQRGDREGYYYINKHADPVDDPSKQDMPQSDFINRRKLFSEQGARGTHGAAQPAIDLKILENHSDRLNVELEKLRASASSKAIKAILADELTRFDASKYIGMINNYRNSDF